MIHIFHGFLGGPEDFARMNDLPDCRIYDLYNDRLPTPTLDDVLIGYSMGGRIALELAERYDFKKLIMINAHPGLSNPQELISRKQWEDGLLKRMDEVGFDEFMMYWNGLEIFANDRPIKGREDLYPESRELFSKHRLSEQKNYLPFLISHREKVHFIIGKQDKKYCALAEEVLIPNGLRVDFLPGGHRLLHDPEALRNLVRTLI